MVREFGASEEKVSDGQKERQPRLSVKMTRVSFGCSASWTRAAQMAASSARVIVLVSLMPCGSTVNIFFVWGQ